MNEYVRLAKNAIEVYIKIGKRIKVPESLPEEFYNCRKGVFVTIYEEHSEKKLRGCIGTFLPTKENVALEIIDNAILAAVHDHRFSPVCKNDLESLVYEVSLLNTPEQINSTENLNPKKYGIIVKSSNRKSGLLLPDIEGVEKKEHQIAIACQKAGIDLSKEKIELYRFTINKY